MTTAAARMTRRTLRTAAAAFVVLAANAARLPASGGDLRVCLIDDDLPRAHRLQAAGFDHDLFREVAERLELRFVPVWRPSAPPYSEIDDTDLPLDSLLEEACDVVPSVPGEIALGRLGDQLSLTPPYYAAAFEFYRPAGDRPLDWNDLARTFGDDRVAVRLQSLGHFAAEAAGLDWTTEPTAAEVTRAVDDRRAAAALIWGPALAALGKTPVADWEPPPGLRFNEHAATRASYSALRRIEQVLEDLRRDGTLRRLAEEYGILRIDPFPTVSSPEAIRALGIGGP